MDEQYVSEKYPSGKPAKYSKRKVACQHCKGSGKVHDGGYYDKRYRPDYDARQGGACFITTACVYSISEGDEETTLAVLRRFREGFVRSVPNGESLIAQYYSEAPSIVRAIDRRSDHAAIYREIYLRLVRPAFASVTAGENSAALQLYADMFNQLREQFLIGASWSDGAGI